MGLFIKVLIPEAPAYADPSPDDRGQDGSVPALTVMLIETQRYLGWLGEYRTPDTAADEIIWIGFIEMRVSILDRLAGPAFPQASDINMVYVAHAVHIPPARMLVIAEPRRDGPGFFVRWYTTARENGEFCVPEQVVKQLHVEAAFRQVRAPRDGEERAYCVRA